MDPDQYCRDVEAYLCRRNAGHLVRLVGPAFEMVVGWAGRGIPIRVVYAGVDRYFERHDAKAAASTTGGRRRPVRIEFCEADVLDAFDAWRRAVGVGAAGAAAVPQPAPDRDEPASLRPGHSLRAHLDRVATRLTDRLVAGGLPSGLEQQVEGLLRDLEGERATARTARGEARQQLMARLQRMDEALLAAVREASEAALVTRVGEEAERELEGFRPRMAEADYLRARDAAVAALLRDHWRLPILAY